jgi:ATP-binding cassette subfamily B (MDR/TAP) protein 1
MTSIRVILGLVASMDLELEQMDVKTAFLHGNLDEEIYMEQPEGFKVQGKEHLVCKLQKSLYGLKQAPRQWYKKFDSFMMGQGYKRTEADQCVYIQKFPDGGFVILLLYVDDMLIVGQNKAMISKLKMELSKFFEMKDLGPAEQILGMKIVRDRKAKKLWLSQQKYVERVIKRFNMEHAKPASTPLANHFKLSKHSCPTTKKEIEEMAEIPYSSAVGSLMYAMVCTRPDIAHAVGVVSRFLSNPGKEHWEAVKWILRYLKGTSKMCLCYGGAKPVMEGYTDSDMAGDLVGRKSTSGFLFTFAGGSISWQSKLQKCVALSTTEAEYIAAAEAGKEMLWVKRFLQELGVNQEEYLVHCDSQSALDLSKNSMYHSRTKHIDIRYHWIREVMEQQLLKLVKIHTSENPADMLTKVVTRDKLELCRDIAGVNVD